MRKYAVLSAVAISCVATASAIAPAGGPAVDANRCTAGHADCVGKVPAPAVREPVVIYLDADGKELVRMPLSKFRNEKPDVKLPASVTAPLSK